MKNVENDSDNSWLQSSDEEEFINCSVEFINSDDPKTLHPPKHLYDCILGLRGDSKERFQ